MLRGCGPAINATAIEQSDWRDQVTQGAARERSDNRAADERARPSGAAEFKSERQQRAGRPRVVRGEQRHDGLGQVERRATGPLDARKTGEAAKSERRQRAGRPRVARGAAREGATSELPSSERARQAQRAQVRAPAARGGAIAATQPGAHKSFGGCCRVVGRCGFLSLTRTVYETELMAPKKKQKQPRAIVFVDANVYILAFKTSDPSYTKLVKVLSEHPDVIFVTQQVADEVERNKLGRATEFVKAQIEKMTLPKIALPGLSAELGETQRQLVAQTDDLRKSAEAEAVTYFELLAMSEDETSNLLKPLFARAEAASPSAYQRARERRERGNPPGKKTDTLGDQLSWEQVLEQLGPGDHLHVLTKDSDYAVELGGKPHLVPMLYREARERVGDAGTITVHETLSALARVLPLISKQAATTELSKSERASAAEVERFLDEVDDQFDVCEACESDGESAPHVVYWSLKSREGNFLTGRCDYCDTLNVKCVDCTEMGALWPDHDEFTCGCDITISLHVERNSHGGMEAHELSITAAEDESQYDESGFLKEPDRREPPEPKEPRFRR